MRWFGRREWVTLALLTPVTFASIAQENPPPLRIQLQIASRSSWSQAAAQGVRFGMAEAAHTAKLLGRDVRLVDDPAALHPPAVTIDSDRVDIRASPSPECRFTVSVSLERKRAAMAAWNAKHGPPAAPSSGLEPAVWHPTVAKYGASELNERFKSATAEAMTSPAWLGWIAVRTIAVGTRPRGVEALKGRLFVALSDVRPRSASDEDAIVALDPASGRRLATYRAGTDPEQLVVSPDARRLYAANEDAGTATAFDLEQNKVLATLVVGIEPEGVAISPDGRWVYVTAETSNTVSVIDTRALKVVSNFLVDPRPRAAVFSADGTRAYVTAEIGGSVSVVDAARHRVIATIELPPEAKPVGVAVSPDGNVVFVANGHGNRSPSSTHARSRSSRPCQPAADRGASTSRRTVGSSTPRTDFRTRSARSGSASTSSATTTGVCRPLRRSPPAASSGTSSGTASMATTHSRIRPRA